MEHYPIRQRAKRKYINVTFPDGKVLCYANITETMIETLKAIGSEKFEQIDLLLCHLPLLSKTIYQQYKKYMKYVCDGWYVNTQSTTENKYMQLHIINNQLGLGLQIEIGEDFDTQKSSNTKKPRAREKLLVRLPNGEYLGNDSATDTYIETIWHIGIEQIMKKHIEYGQFELITSSQKIHSQVQIGINRWLCIPSSTKDKAKLLKVIAILTKTNISISLI